MQRILITGMSGTGKSAVIRKLTARGYKAVDTDYNGWSGWVDMETGRPASPPADGEDAWEQLDWVWNEARMKRLLSEEDGDILFVAGTSPNQGKFYPQFDYIILLSAPVEVVLERLQTRKNNPYGTTPSSQARVLEHIQTVEPLLRQGADYEINTSIPLEQVVEQILEGIGIDEER